MDERTPRWRRASTRPSGLAVATAINAVLIFGGALPVAAQELDPTKAKAQFLSSCGVCHTAEKGGANRQGPNLYDIIGKPAAARDDFKFSEALKSSGFVWDEAMLDRWIEDAAAVRPGTIMAYRQRDAERRRLVIAYLKSLAEPK
ncbi:c-type cytochrome [Bosea sp. BK604]|uniref:c-type cytochrome n=1 Tax=Bosea sp. BK604 TaxID=2512180 RepID=UPI001A9E71F6|nr:c-type cytochrome [Bosea sp. BK604]